MQEQPGTRFYVLTALSGVGKTYTGDFLQTYFSSCAHIDGDAMLLRRDLVPEYKKIGYDLEKAYHSHWLKNEDAPPGLWQPYYKVLSNRMEEAAKTKEIVVLTQSAYRREARDYLRNLLPGVCFIKLQCDEDILCKGAHQRFIDYAKAHEQTPDELWMQVKYNEKFGDKKCTYENHKKVQKTFLTGFEKFHDDEGKCATVDMSKRDASVLVKICDAMGLQPVAESEIDMKRIKAVNEKRVEDLARERKELERKMATDSS